jgi:hypothetical protein
LQAALAGQEVDRDVRFGTNSSRFWANLSVVFSVFSKRTPDTTLSNHIKEAQPKHHMTKARHNARCTAIGHPDTAHVVPRLPSSSTTRHTQQLYSL